MAVNKDPQSIDEANLASLREFTILKSEKLFEVDFYKLLEIGPPRITGALNSGIYIDNPQWHFNLQQWCKSNSKTYASLDLDKNVNADFVGSIDDPNLISVHSGLKEFDRIVCFSVLEHCNNPFQAVENINQLLAPSGVVHFITPWDLRFHGPRPDCWRISDDGYRALLGDKFQIISIEYLPQPTRPLSPVAIYCEARKVN
jgi:hypothetical protein